MLCPWTMVTLCADELPLHSSREKQTLPGICVIKTVINEKRVRKIFIGTAGVSENAATWNLGLFLGKCERGSVGHPWTLPWSNVHSSSHPYSDWSSVGQLRDAVSALCTSGMAASRESKPMLAANRCWPQNNWLYSGHVFTWSHWKRNLTTKAENLSKRYGEGRKPFKGLRL